MPHRMILSIALGALLALGAGVAAAGSPGDPAQEIKIVRLPAGAYQARCAVDAGGTVHLIYCTGDARAADIQYARSSDSGATFSPAIRVNSQPGSAIAIGTIRGPRLAVGRSGRVHVAWMGSQQAEPKAPAGGGAAQLPMLYARMNDAGDAFETQRNVIVSHPGLDGGGAVAADPESDDVYIVWHAPRRFDAKRPGSEAMNEANRTVLATISHDDGKTFAPEVDMGTSAPSPGACACCGMTALARGGKLFVLYRCARQQVHRDMTLLTSTARGKPLGGQIIGPWQVGACVMSTAALLPADQSADSPILAAWEQEERVRLGRFDPASGAMSSSVSPDKGDHPQKYPVLARGAGGQTLLAWIENDGWGKRGTLHWQAFDRDGNPAGAAGQADGVPAWGTAAVVARGDGSFTLIY